MNLDEFDYRLPPELVAQMPAEPRDSARLLVVERTTGTISHHTVRELPSLLPAETLTVLNTSRVRPSRLHVSSKGGKPYEILILEPIDTLHYRCLVGGGRVRVRDQYLLTDGNTATITHTDDGPGMSTARIAFSSDPLPLAEIPLPPYITHYHGDKERYQTVYSDSVGSAAAPTAGLHLTRELLAQLQPTAQVTLHVGLGTFLPLRSNVVGENRLHREQTSVTAKEAGTINAWVSKRKPLLAVGTTSIRTLESRSLNGPIVTGDTYTDLFIQPGFQFKTATALLTNFHLPKSSLLVLLTAFLANSPTREVVRSEQEALSLFHSAYAEAVARRYRFYSFGDAMLIL